MLLKYERLLALEKIINNYSIKLTINLFLGHFTETHSHFEEA